MDSPFEPSSGPNAANNVALHSSMVSVKSLDEASPMSNIEQDHETPNQQTSESTWLSPLCTFCKAIFDQWDTFLLDAKHRVPHYGLWSEVEASAENCSLCTQFVRADEIHLLRASKVRLRSGKVVDRGSTTADGGKDTTHPTFVTGQESRLVAQKKSSNIPPDPNLEGYVTMNFPGAGFGRAEKANRLHLRQPDKEKRKEPTRHIVSIVQQPSQSENVTNESGRLTDGLNTKDSLGLCRTWLHRCLHHHQICNEPRSEFIPTRLVSLLGPFPNLVEPGKLCDIKTYATLSHCWGTSPFPTLTNVNIQEFCQQIPSEALSKTFLDAIFVCKELGIDYIWIDSLCILQDDADDWEKEAALMTKVYRSSHLNIAATGSSDGTVGLFHDRRPHWHCRVEVTSPVSKQIFDCVPFWMYGGSIDYEPLSRRGWAFQESILPPRTLQFTRTQVFWNCEDTINCEIFPDAFPLGIYKSTGWQDFAVVRKQPVHESDWRATVVSYTQRLLTFQEDKLIAISGLAREIQCHRKDDYCAGIWLKDLQFQLCWLTQSRKGAEIAPMDRKIAPSWSWASVQDPVYFTFKPIQVFIQGLAFESPPGEDPFGVVSTAKVALACYEMWQGTLGGLETFEVAALSRQRTKVLLGQEEHEDVLVNISDVDEVDISNIWFMPVAICDHTEMNPRYPEMYSPHRLALAGLILQPLDMQPGYYHRVGAFEKDYQAATMEECRGMIYKGLLDSIVGRAGDEMYQRIYEDDGGVTWKAITLV